MASTIPNINVTTTNRRLPPFRSQPLPSRAAAAASSGGALRRSHHDVVVIGAGIIGLTIAREFLLRTDLSVAIVDSRVPCSGATGAGQGYVWMGHRAPGSELWEICRRSKQLWEEVARGIEMEGRDPSKVIGWRKTGSLLIGRTTEEKAMLEERVKLLTVAGLRAEYLSSTALQFEEPEVDAGGGGAAFFPDDCQFDAKLAVSFIEKNNRLFSSEGRYFEFYNNPAVGLLSTRGEVEAVQTSGNILYGRQAIIISTGAWSGSIMKNFIKSDDIPNVPVKPRKGHLLVLENKMKIPINHGIMEMGYAKHLGAGATSVAIDIGKDDKSLPSISMTVTTDIDGNLVLGSSRQFVGFNMDVDDYIIEKIWERVGEFFPRLRMMPLQTFEKKIRTGLRPWMPDGKPLIGPIPGLPKVLLATGHEGGGLTMALGTAELIVDMTVGSEPKIDPTPFSISRLS